jgi:hypothetical protein
MLHSCNDRYGELFKRQKIYLSMVSENFAVSAKSKLIYSSSQCQSRSEVKITRFIAACVNPLYFSNFAIDFKLLPCLSPLLSYLGNCEECKY